MTGPLVVDVGSTFVKASWVDGDGTVRGPAQAPTVTGEPLRGVVDALGHELGAVSPGLLACSSAGGGLRLAVVGFERQVTAEAGYRVGLSAGARVVHVAAGLLDAAAVEALRCARPDVVLLTGGTDGGNAEALRHNASRIARSRLPRRVPIVVAGNIDAADAVADELRAARRPAAVTSNVLPRIGTVTAGPARAAIREVFLSHVIGGKGLTTDPDLRRAVRAATPDAMLAGVEVLADALGQDIVVVDIGGATTDVYSVVVPRGEDAGLRRDVVGALPAMRTVEGDLGMRWSAPSVVQAAQRERLGVSDGLAAHAARVAADPTLLPTTAQERALDEELARWCAVVALRRHARPGAAGEPGRFLADVGLVIGSGGLMRADPDAAQRVLDAVITDAAGGWVLPRHARTRVDARYLLVVVGLLAMSGDPARAGAVARYLLQE